jgi:hypothetical protein
VVNGEPYLACKKAIVECFKVKNIQPLEAELKNYAKLNCPHHPLLAYLGPAFYQKVTLLYKNASNFNSNIGDLFKPLLENPYASIDASDKALLAPLLDNSFANNLKISETNWQFIDLNLLLVQIKFSILYGRSVLLKPLQTLLQKPIETIEHYFPTMPQDNLYDVKHALNDPSVNHETTRFYSCPNGHIYVIGNVSFSFIVK